MTANEKKNGRRPRLTVVFTSFRVFSLVRLASFHIHLHRSKRENIGLGKKIQIEWTKFPEKAEVINAVRNVGKNYGNTSKFSFESFFSSSRKISPGRFSSFSSLRQSDFLIRFAFFLFSQIGVCLSSLIGDFTHILFNLFVCSHE